VLDAEQHATRATELEAELSDVIHERVHVIEQWRASAGHVFERRVRERRVRLGRDDGARDSLCGRGGQSRNLDRNGVHQRQQLRALFGCGLPSRFAQRHEQVFHAMGQARDLGLLDDPRCALERVPQAQQARHVLGAGLGALQLEHAALQLVEDLARFDAKVLQRVRHASARYAACPSIGSLRFDQLE
jgi:hypothetical protein